MDFLKHLTLLIKVAILRDRDLQEETRYQSSFFFVGWFSFLASFLFGKGGGKVKMVLIKLILYSAKERVLFTQHIQYIGSESWGQILGRNTDKSLIFLLAIQSHLDSFVLRFLQTFWYNAPPHWGYWPSRTKVLVLQTEKIRKIQSLVPNVINSSPIGATGLFQPYTTL